MGDFQPVRDRGLCCQSEADAEEEAAQPAVPARFHARSGTSSRGTVRQIALGQDSVKKSDLLRFNGAVERDPAIDAWMAEHSGELGDMARRWFEAMRACGDEVRELVHDGCPVACFGDVPFGYVNVFRSHVNVGFFQGATLADPAGLLQGSGKFMRHVRLSPGTAINAAALGRLIEAAYEDIKRRVEHG